MTDIHDWVRELTRTHIAQAEYQTDQGTRWHYTTSPGLLTQLESAAPSSAGESRGSNGYASRPAARIDALDTLMTIDREASAWVRFLGHDDPGSTAACVAKVGSLYPSATEQCQRNIARDAKSWWTQARITTGYDTAAWRPDNTCPLCGEKGTLRVKLAHHTAMCTSCREVWEPDVIALLADHIRAENCEDQPELGLGLEAS